MQLGGSSLKPLTHTRPLPLAPASELQRALVQRPAPLVVVQRLPRNCGLCTGLEGSQKGLWDEAGLTKTMGTKQRRHVGNQDDLEVRPLAILLVWSGRTLGNGGFSPQACV